MIYLAVVSVVAMAFSKWKADLAVLLVKEGIHRISEGSRISFKFNLILKRFKVNWRTRGRQENRERGV